MWTTPYVIKERFHFFSNKSLLDKTDENFSVAQVSYQAILTILTSNTDILQNNIQEENVSLNSLFSFRLSQVELAVFTHL